MMQYQYRAASLAELERIWDKDIASNRGDERWIAWKATYIAYNRRGQCRSFIVACDGEPVGQGTLLFSPECRAVRGRTELADGRCIANVNALRIEPAHEGQGHISRLMRVMERYAAEQGYARLTIGVEAEETRNLAIYLHWGFDTFVKAEADGGALVLYYAKQLQPARK